MRVVLDTNIIVASLASWSKSHHIIQALLDGQFEMIISHEILLEYDEVLNRKYSPSVADGFLKALDHLPNVTKTDIFFHWNLIANDPEDNKFVDATIAAGQAVLVTEDKHFNILKQIDFPPLTVMNLKDFESLLLNP